MIASEKGGRGAERQRGRSAFLDEQVAAAMQSVLALAGVGATSRTAVIGGKRLHFLEAGEGEPLLFIHGASGGGANWYRLIEPLSGRFRTIAIDLPGFGLSDPVEPAAPLGRQIAGILAGFLDTLGVRRPHLVATSFGGLVALRLASLVDSPSVSVIDSAGLWPEASLGLKVACLPFAQRLAVKQSRLGARWVLRRVLIARRLPAAHEAALVDYIVASAARGDVRMLARAYALFGSWRGQVEVLSENELRELAPRLLIIWGEEDRFLPAPIARRRAALAAGARLRIIPGVGHSPNWEAPDEVLEAILGFLGRH